MQKQQIAKYRLVRGLRSIVFVLPLLMVFALAFSIAPRTSALTSLSQGYSTNEKISLGSIVSLENNSTDHVIATTINAADSILGVVINGDNSLISLSNGKENQVQVATSGLTSVLVSDINGEIKQGDQITASPIKGVGMKATGNTKVVGIAQGSPINSSSEPQYYTDSDGNQKSVRLGEVPVLINVAYFFKEPEKTIIPQAIQNIANAIAGKEVDTLPIIISSAIFIITVIIVSSIIFSMIRSSIISVGRNPMSQSAVYRDVVQLSVLVLVILSVAMLSIYIILTRL